MCNTSTGYFDITWNVGGDTSYANETATIKTQSMATIPTLVGTSVKGASSVTGVQAAVGAGAHYLTVQVQWTNHSVGDLVSQTGLVTTSGSCVVADADATIDVSGPTCDTAQTLVLNPPKNATWGVPTNGTDGNGNKTFSVTATAMPNHAFADGLTTKPFTGTLLAATGGCTPPPCLDKSAVSYTYNATTNSGVITVAAQSGHSNTLCKPFWVVAASWKFIGNTMWPQHLDQWNPATGDNLNASNGSIDKVGVYYYAANVDCGQGDIYATFDLRGVPTVPAPQNLNGPSNPYDEFFLHQMGFTGPNPTYTVQDAGACNAVSAGVVFQGYQCNVFGPLVLSGTHVTFTVKYDDAPGGEVSGVVPGSYELLANFAAKTGDRYFGQVTVTAFADSGYSLLSLGTPVPLTANTAVPAAVKMATMQTEWVLAANLPQDCPTVVPTVPAVTFTDVCGVTTDLVNVPTLDGVVYNTVDSRTNGVGTVTVTATPAATYVFDSSVTKTSWSFDFTNVDCPTITPLAPSAFDPTCPAGVEAGASGYIQLDLKDHLHYAIDGVSTTQARNELAPGTYTVSVTADSGFTLSGPASWEMTINPSFCPPTLALLSTTASSTNITCTAPGTYTLANTEGIEWFVNGSTTATPAGTYKVADASTVNVQAKLVDTVNDGWEDGAQQAWTFNFTNPIDCLPTLAFTGANGGNLGLLLAGGLLLFGGTIIAFERRFRFGAR